VKRPIFILLVIGALVSAQPVVAQGSSSNPSQQKDQLIAKLESRVAGLDSQLARTGVPQARSDAAAAIERQRIRDQRQQLSGLIEKLRTGQQVSPAEIDRAFGTGTR